MVDVKKISASPNVLLSQNGICTGNCSVLLLLFSGLFSYKILKPLSPKTEKDTMEIMYVFVYTYMYS